MSEDVLYTTRWADTSRRPFPGHQWLSVEDARARWDAGYDARGLVSVVDAATRDADGTPRPRWVIFGSSTRRVSVEFFTPGGSVWRSIDYDAVGERLWRWICVTYVYPDPDTHYALNQASRIIKEKFRPDGTGTVRFDENDGMFHTAKLTDAPVDGFWLDRPQFGDWADLTNPEYGVPRATAD